MKSKWMTFVPVTLILLVTVMFPSTVEAQLVPCTGTDCTFCDLVALGSNVINWFFGLVFVLFGVITFVAGFNLMTSGGNQTKLDDAKKKLSNAVIGLIIVFSAWLIVDTLMKAIVPDGDVGAAVGSSGLGMWNRIECAAQPTPAPGRPLAPAPPPLDSFTLLDTFVGEATDPGYPAFVANCTSLGGSPVINPDSPGVIECRGI